MASFTASGTVTFSERGSGRGQGFPVWAADMPINQVAIPRGAPVLQSGGRSAQTLDLPFQCSISNYISLLGKCGKQGALVIALGTFTAVLQSLSGIEINANSGIVQGTAKFLRVG